MEKIIRIRRLVVLPLLLFVCTFPFYDYMTMLKEIIRLPLGRLPSRVEIALLPNTLSTIALTLVGISLDILILLLILPLIHLEDFPRKDPPWTNLSISQIALVVLLEELLARGLLFGLPLHFLSYNIVVFYICWIISNGIWAILHLWNYPKGHRSLWLILPQFVHGLFIESYAFLKFGFWMSYAVHFFHNIVTIALRGEGKLK
ncbi:CPBP family intramembrane metalloprotease, partial [Candidatus Parcubacteria bacterium]|nr:CPBP family intramembrane metalloprotease [Candidatus Parcubacteria bacterium]